MQIACLGLEKCSICVIWKCQYSQSKDLALGSTEGIVAKKDKETHTKRGLKMSWKREKAKEEPQMGQIVDPR